MSTMIILIIAAVFIFVAIALLIYHFRKQKTYFVKLKELVKRLKKQQKAHEKSGKKLEAYKNHLFKKNDEMMKRLLKNQE